MLAASSTIVSPSSRALSSMTMIVAVPVVRVSPMRIVDDDSV